ncbi:MAG: peptidylprolyl isomerase [bacterium]
MRKTLWLLAAAAAAAAAGCMAQEEPVVARVGDARLTAVRLQQSLPPGVLAEGSREELLDYVNGWIRSELLYQTAREMGYHRDQRVKDRIREASREIIIDVFLEDELDMRPFISDEEIASYYRNNQDAFRRSREEVQFSALWFDDRAEAREVREFIQGGRSFQEASEDSSFRVAGSSLDPEFVHRNEIEPSLADLLFRLEPGVLSAPVEVEGGWVIARVTDRQEAGSVRALWEVHDDIMARLASDLRDLKLEEMLSRLLEESDVSIDLDAVTVRDDLR